MITTKADYITMIEASFQQTKDFLPCHPRTKFEYLAEHIFDFTTYDGSMSDMFGRRAVMICEIINNSSFGHIEDGDHYQWYLIMCNMPFFVDKIEWGTSIRGAWWDPRGVTLNTCSLWDGYAKIKELKFTTDQWREFIQAIIEFSRKVDA